MHSQSRLDVYGLGILGLDTLGLLSVIGSEDGFSVFIESIKLK